jgi:hypothetical protein
MVKVVMASAPSVPWTMILLVTMYGLPPMVVSATACETGKMKHTMNKTRWIALRLKEIKGRKGRAVFMSYLSLG